jgi:uncharacterized membrane protein YbhN (UPF0104 family)
MSADQQTPSLSNDTLPPAGAKSAGRISIWRLLGTILSLALLVYLIYMQWEEIIQVFASLPAIYIWAGLGLMLLSRISVGLRWYALLRSAGVKVSLWQSLRLTFMGLFASNFLPTTIGGDLVRMAGILGLRVDSGLGAASLVVDRLVGMTGMASMAPFGLAIILQPAVASSTGEVLQLSLLLALKRLPGVGWILRKTETFLRSLLSSSIYWLRHPRSLVLALLCTFGHMLFTFLSIWLLLQGMHQSLSIWRIGALWSLNYFITTFLPISINGLGLQEITVHSLYVTFGGVSVESGLALAVLMRLLPTLASLPGAFFLPEILRLVPAMRKPARADQEQEST